MLDCICDSHPKRVLSKALVEAGVLTTGSTKQQCANPLQLYDIVICTGSEELPPVHLPSITVTQ